MRTELIGGRENICLSLVNFDLANLCEKYIILSIFFLTTKKKIEYRFKCILLASNIEFNTSVEVCFGVTF